MRSGRIEVARCSIPSLPSRGYRLHLERTRLYHQEHILFIVETRVQLKDRTVISQVHHKNETERHNPHTVSTDWKLHFPTLSALRKKITKRSQSASDCQMRLNTNAMHEIYQVYLFPDTLWKSCLYLATELWSTVNCIGIAALAIPFVAMNQTRVKKKEMYTRWEHASALTVLGASGANL